MKVKVQPVEVQWNTAVLALKRGDCDFFGSSFVYNAPRALEVTFITAVPLERPECHHQEGQQEESEEDFRSQQREGHDRRGAGLA